MATKRIVVDGWGFDGEPLSGATPSWKSYAVDGTSGTGPTPITEAPAGSGLYAVTLTGTAGQHITGVIDLGADANGRYKLVDEHVDEWPAVLRDAIAAKLATDHGSGAWGAGASGANTVTVTTTGVVGARVCVRLAGTVLDVKYTNGSGVASFLLDDGTYTVEITAPGYQSSTTSLTVSDDTSATRTLTALSTESTSPTGVTRTVDCAAPTLGTTIEGIVAGDTINLSRTITSLPAAITSAKLTVKRAADSLAPDAGAVLQVSATVSDTGADGTGALTVAITPTQSLTLDQPYAYDLQLVLAGGAVVTPETGTIAATPGVTSAVS